METLLSAAGRAPSLRKMLSIRHHLVKPLCNRLAPTKAVNASHHWLTNSGLPGTPRASESRMKRAGDDANDLPAKS